MTDLILTLLIGAALGIWAVRLLRKKPGKAGHFIRQCIGDPPLEDPEAPSGNSA